MNCQDLITCEDLTYSARVALNFGVETVEFYGILLMLLKRYGRVATSKRLGLRERLVRRVIEISRKKPEVLRVVSNLKKATLTSKVVTCTPVFYMGLSPSLLNAIRQKVVYLRDHIVIYSRDPGKVGVIGVFTEGVVDYPGVPPEIARPYLEAVYAELEQIGNTGVIVCWNSYRGELDDGVLVAALASFCEFTGTERQQRRAECSI